MVILDTDHMSVLERGGSGALTLAMKLGVLSDRDIATTIISYEEQCKGWLAKTAREKDEALIRSYQQLGIHLEIYAGMQVLPFDSNAHQIFVQLQLQKIRIGTQDLKIAAISLSKNAVLLTRNLRHFEQVPGIQAENWTT
jgi:tRNA(fMet)-specific endonuclease VapC